MDGNTFRFWLRNVKRMKASSANNRVSNCARVEEFEGNLDTLFEQDSLVGLLEKLTYSKAEQRRNLPPRHSVPIYGDTYNGTATLRAAVKLYREFSAVRNSFTGISPIVKPVKQPVKTTGNWPTWNLPESEVILALTKMVTPYVRFLHPDIVAQVVEDNERNITIWRKKLRSRGIDPDFYLWGKSSCAFPSIRRHAGSKEIAYFHKHLTELDIPDALVLDDNTFPKHIWSFIFRGKKFQNLGPDGYALAHLADHKDYKNRRKYEFESVGRAPEKLYGLYTCVSNTVYMPTTLLKLTDFNMQTRLLLLHKAQSLYGGVCNILPKGFKLKPQISPEWDVGKFEWSAPVVADDAALKNFFLFREEVINSAFAAK